MDDREHTQREQQAEQAEEAGGIDQGSRIRIPTSKGRAYNLQLHQRIFEGAYRRVMNISDKVKELLPKASSSDFKDVEANHAKWLDAYEEFVKGYESYHCLVEEDDDDLADLFQERKQELKDVKFVIES